ncbi:MAG: hypothetical protein R2704_13475 [Microthrixaceae bacterium]
MTDLDLAPAPSPITPVVAHAAPVPLGALGATRRILALKVALLTSLARTSLMHAIGLGLGTVAAGIFAGGMGLGIAAAARTSDWIDPVLVVGATILPVVAMLFGAMVGSEGTIDPRRLAVLPLSNSALSGGVLASALVGPAGVAGALLCVGVIAGYLPMGPGALIVQVATLGLLVLVATSARLMTNVLGMLGRPWTAPPTS